MKILAIFLALFLTTTLFAQSEHLKSFINNNKLVDSVKIPSNVQQSKAHLWGFLNHGIETTSKGERALQVEELCDTTKVVYSGYDNMMYDEEYFEKKEIIVPVSASCDSILSEIAKGEVLVVSDANQSFMSTLTNDSLVTGNISMADIKATNARDYEDILNKYGFFDFEDITFRVQLGAFKNKDSFDPKPFEEYGKVLNYILDDGITRFTIGDYSYLRRADNLKKWLREKGYSDVFVVVFSEGKRQFDFRFSE